MRDYGWSPDSSRVAYIANLSQVITLELFTTERDSMNVVKESDDAPPVDSVVQAFSYSPDGSRLAYVSDQSAAGLGVNVLYSTVERSGSPIEVSAPLVADGDVTKFEWSSDSATVFYLADSTTNDIDELHAADPTMASSGTVISGTLVEDGSVKDFLVVP